MACAIAVSGCGGSEERTSLTASLSSVEPVCGSTASDTAITIRGAMPVKPVVSLSGGSESSLEAQYRAWVGDVELVDVRWVDAGSISATVPAGVAPGIYALTIESPFGDRSSIDALFQVAAGLCNPASAALRIDASAAPAVVRVGDRVVVTVTIRNTGQATATGVTTAVAAPPGFTRFTSTTDPLDVAGGDSRSFTWTYTAEAGAGNGTFAATAAGLDSSSGESVSAPEATTNRVAVAYAVGGTTFGLEGSGLVLQLNGANDRAITANGAFTFGDLPSGTDLQVTIASQPSNPTQTCNVSGGTSTVGTGPVTAIVVNCAVNTFTIGGRVTGLIGSGLVLREATSNQTAAITSAGTYAFATPVPSGRAYAVTVSAQPASPAQTCTVANGSGTVAAANVSNVDVSCTTNPVTLTVAKVGTGTVTAAPATPPLTCNATSCSGTYPYSTDVTLTATAAVGWTFTGWSGESCSGTGTCAVAMTRARSVTATFTLNSYPVVITQTANGTVTGPSAVQHGASATFTATPTTGYSVGAWSGCTAAVGATSCTVSNVTGPFTVSTTFVANTYQVTYVQTAHGTVAGPATVVHGTDATFTATPATGYNVGTWSGCAAAAGAMSCTVPGVTGPLTVSATFVPIIYPVTYPPTVNGTVTGPTTVQHGTSATFTATPSPGYSVGTWSGCTAAAGATTCTVTSATGPLAVSATFVPIPFTVGGTVSGLTGNDTVTLQLNGGNDLSERAGPFRFTNAPLHIGNAYIVTIPADPPGYVCEVASGSGTIGTANVTNVAVTCLRLAL